MMCLAHTKKKVWKTIYPSFYNNFLDHNLAEIEFSFQYMHLDEIIGSFEKLLSKTTPNPNSINNILIVEFNAWLVLDATFQPLWQFSLTIACYSEMRHFPRSTFLRYHFPLNLFFILTIQCVSLDSPSYNIGISSNKISGFQTFPLLATRCSF